MKEIKLKAQEIAQGYNFIAGEPVNTEAMRLRVEDGCRKMAEWMFEWTKDKAVFWLKTSLECFVNGGEFGEGGIDYKAMTYAFERDLQIYFDRENG